MLSRTAGHKHVSHPVILESWVTKLASWRTAGPQPCLKSRGALCGVPLPFVGPGPGLRRRHHVGSLVLASARPCDRSCLGRAQLGQSPVCRDSGIRPCEPPRGWAWNMDKQWVPVVCSANHPNVFVLLSPFAGS